MPTVLLNLKSSSGQIFQARALLDSASEITIINHALVQQLKLPLNTTETKIKALGGVPVGSSGHTTYITILKDNIQPLMRKRAFVVRNIGIRTPAKRLIRLEWPSSKDSELADPRYHIPGMIDVILGADAMSNIFKTKARNDSCKGLLAMNTVFGWIIMGTTLQIDSFTPVTASVQTDNDINILQNLSDLLQRFWSLEEVPNFSKSSLEEEECETIFKNGIQRDDSGRYIVRLPFKSSKEFHLSNNLPAAMRMLNSLEKRMRADHLFCQEVEKFMDVYKKMGHMKAINKDQLSTTKKVCYIPYHGIWQKGDNQQKLRIVFNGSYKDASGQSLNSLMHTGAKLQQD